MTDYVTADSILQGLQSNPHDSFPAAELERLRPQAEKVAARTNARIATDPLLRKVFTASRCEISVSMDTLGHGKQGKENIMAATPEEIKTEVGNVVKTLNDLATKAETVEGLPPAFVGVLEAGAKILGVGEKILNDLP